MSQIRPSLTKSFVYVFLTPRSENHISGQGSFCAAALPDTAWASWALLPFEKPITVDTDMKWEKAVANRAESDTVGHYNPSEIKEGVTNAQVFARSFVHN